jgi:hypothetical protein
LESIRRETIASSERPIRHSQRPQRVTATSVNFGYTSASGNAVSTPTNGHSKHRVHSKTGTLRPGDTLFVDSSSVHDRTGRGVTRSIHRRPGGAGLAGASVWRPRTQPPYPGVRRPMHVQDWPQFCNLESCVYECSIRTRHRAAAGTSSICHRSLARQSLYRIRACKQDQHVRAPLAMPTVGI